jgi:hypothetical protein
MWCGFKIIADPIKSELNLDILHSHFNSHRDSSVGIVTRVTPRLNDS